jgi:PAS domain S-box-containing protein
MKTVKGISADPAKLRSRAEEQVKKRKTKPGIPLTKAEISKLLHELQVHQIELEMQNEELMGAKKEIEAGFERFVDLYDFAPVGYFTFDGSGMIREVNLTGARLLGTERSRLVNKRFELFITVEDRPVFSSFLRKTFEGKGKEFCEITLKNQAFLIHMEATASLGGQECRAVLADISERAKAEGEIKKLNDDLKRKVLELAEVNKELEAFISSVSHDLRAPLRHMSLFARNVVADYADRLDEQGKDYLTRVHYGAEKMNQLVEDLLNLSKISRRKLNHIEVDMSKIALDIIAELREAEPTRRVEVDIKKGIIAYADRGLIEIVLSNLIGNSWKFTSNTETARIEFGSFEGTVPDLGTMRGGGAEAGLPLARQTVYYVKDNGAGFNPEYMEKMFLPFQRLHMDSEFEGTGMGLAIVERIIRRHGGRIWAEGAAGKGATIFFTLA